MQLKRCKPWCKLYHTPNQPSFALKCFLLSKMYTADCKDHWTKQMPISYFLWMILKLNRFKRSIPDSFKHEYTIFPVPRPSYPPPPPRYNVGISSALNSRPIQNSYATIACVNSIERRPTLIRGRGICLHIYHILKLQNRISVLNVLVVFELTLCEHNLNFGKTKQYAIRKIQLQNWTEQTKFSAK